jgi:glutamate-ammonia-ligase adenylyltransferase
MRAKIDQHKDHKSMKRILGSLLDLEFLVQFLVLDLGSPDLARYTHTLSQLQHLFLAGVLNQEQLSILKKAYRQYHHLVHQNLLRPWIDTDDTMYERFVIVYQQFF